MIPLRLFPILLKQQAFSQKNSHQTIEKYSAGNFPIAAHQFKIRIAQSFTSEKT